MNLSYHGLLEYTAWECAAWELECTAWELECTELECTAWELECTDWELENHGQIINWPVFAYPLLKGKCFSCVFFNVSKFIYKW